jgi:hypothetical protein
VPKPPLRDRSRIGWAVEQKPATHPRRPLHQRVAGGRVGASRCSTTAVAVRPDPLAPGGIPTGSDTPSATPFRPSL